jgi:lysylphosphatidylglycerol synthase-like protein
MSRKFQIVVFALGALAFSYLVAHAGVRGLLRSLAEAKWALPPIIAVWGVVYALNTYAWRRLLRITRVPMPDDGDRERDPTTAGEAESNATIPFFRAYVISVASFAINYVTPFVNLGGEPFRIAAAAPWVGRSRAAASVVSFRLTHTLAQLVFWLTSIPLGFLLLPHRRGVIISLSIVASVLATVVLSLLGLARRGVAERALNALARIPLTRRLAARLEPEREVFVRVDRELAALMGPGRPHFVAALAAEFVGRSVAMLEYLVIARAIGLPVGYLTAFVIGAFSQFVQNITFFIPLDMGTKEGGLYLIFQLLRLPPQLGVYSAIVSRLRELAWIAVGLGFVWLSRGGRPDYILRYTQSESPQAEA